MESLRRKKKVKMMKRKTRKIKRKKKRKKKRRRRKTKKIKRRLKIPLRNHLSPKRKKSKLLMTLKMKLPKTLMLSSLLISNFSRE